MVATAVSEKKFAKYYQQTASATKWTHGMFQLGLAAFIFNMGILVVALTVATTSNRPTILVCGMIVPALIIVPCFALFHMVLTFVGRTAFSGYLMVSYEVHPESPTSLDVQVDGISAAAAEKVMCLDCFRGLNGKDEEVLDQQMRQVHALNKSTPYHHHRYRAEGSRSSSFIRNSKLVVPSKRKHNIGADYFPKYQEPQKPPQY
eukprot:scaffold562_cov79-Cylindrotheca_fusiformis.AAC.1